MQFNVEETGGKPKPPAGPLITQEEAQPIPAGKTLADVRVWCAGHGGTKAWQALTPEERETALAAPVTTPAHKGCRIITREEAGGVPSGYTFAQIIAWCCAREDGIAEWQALDDEGRDSALATFTQIVERQGGIAAWDALTDEQRKAILAPAPAPSPAATPPPFPPNQ